MNFNGWPLRRGLSRGDRTALIGQLALMLDTGIALDSALKAASEQTDSPRLRSVALDLEHRIQDGMDLSAALAHHPESFDPIFIALVRASEKTGSLAQCLMQQADHQERDHAQARRIRAAMTYPMLMFGLAIVVTVLLVAFVLPQFTPMFQQRGVKLPVATRWLMCIGDSVSAHWLWWLLAGVALVSGCGWVLLSGHLRRTVDRAKLAIPIWGPAYRKAVLCRCVRTLGMLLGNQVPVLESLKLCAKVSGSEPYEAAWQEVADRVATGSRIAESLPKRLFPPTLRQMFRAGEDTGRLSGILDKISLQYERDVELAFKAATSL
ncbi:MAG: type II secretion system F family protein, partial [Planctomycetales bacterium]|nr:type II secretion system F family protein [Planctomycetales bacterium]